jgi:hypothetical protein
MRVRIRRFGRLRSRLKTVAPRTSVSSRRRRGFTASPGPRGFTPVSRRELQLPGLLAPGPFETRGQYALPSVRPFAPQCDAALLRPRLTSRSTSRRRLFRREARPPQVRALAFPAKPPDLRRLPLVARASRSLARSPWSASPRIRFLFVGWRLRSPLPSALPSQRYALRFARGPCDQVPQRTCTSWSVPMLGAQAKEPRPRWATGAPSS